MPGRQQAFGPKDEVLNKVLQRPSLAAAAQDRAGSRELIVTDSPTVETNESIQRHMVAGVTVVLMLVGGVGGWAATTELSGALIAPGSIVVDTNIKKVQHPTGGVVGEVRVRDGDRVKAGDIVVRLDETVTRANLSIVTKGLNELAARKARLEAERDGLDAIKFPDELIARQDDADVAGSMSSERKLFESAPQRAHRAARAIARSGSGNCRKRSAASPRSRPPRARKSC